MSNSEPIFASFFQAGFECSTHRNKIGKRLDLIAATRHDQFAKGDFLALRRFGICTVRDGARWHLIEEAPGRYNFDTLAPVYDAAQETGTELLLDLFHFGWPEHLDVFGPRFGAAFEDFTAAFLGFLKRRGITAPFLSPLNEISFLAWGAGDKGFVFPYAVGRGGELKRILIDAALRSARLIRREMPATRLIWPEPVIHIIGDPDVPGSDREAAEHRAGQFEAWDMLSGRMAPELGGSPDVLEIIGVNFYDRNEWIHNRTTQMKRYDPDFLPLHRLLQEVWDRYRRPMFISETGTEDDDRAGWFHYVCREVQIAHARGVPVHGVCWYPIANHLGWEDDRYCCNGLFDHIGEDGLRPIHEPLAKAILAEQNTGAFERFNRTKHDDLLKARSGLLLSSEVELCLSTPSAPDEPLCQT